MGKKTRKDYLVILARRKHFLERRLAVAGRPLGYDNNERDALKWALQALCEQFHFDVRDIERAAESDKTLHNTQGRRRLNNDGIYRENYGNYNKRTS